MIGLELEDIPLLHFTLWLLGDVLHRQVFLSSACQGVVEATEASTKNLLAVLEGMGRVVWLRGCTKQ